MKVLGIETSCDETAVAVVEDGLKVLASTVASQVPLHRAYGGIVPEVACRAHVAALLPALETALKQSGISLKDVDAVAATHAPGLVGSLLVGLTAGKTLAWVLDRPFLAVNHLAAHLHATRMADPAAPYPAVTLLASGGHTALYLSRADGEDEAVGRTVDDAAGEAFDKAAKVLGLGYPGGPEIDRLAASGRADAIDFPRGEGPGPYDFSFSGLKTAVLYRCRGPRGKDPLALTEPEKADVAASFQEAVVDALVARTMAAARDLGAASVRLSGGVACNRRLRAKIKEEAEQAGMAAVCPPPALCTDNAAMVAGLAGILLAKGERSSLDVDAFARVEGPLAGRRFMAKGARASK